MNKLKLIIPLVVLVISFGLDLFLIDFIPLVQNNFLDYIFTWFSHFLTLIVLLLIFSTIFLIDERKTKYVPFLFYAMLGAIIGTTILKFIIMRERPFDEELILPILLIKDYSFPSTHAAIAFALSGIIAKAHPHLKYYFFGFAVLVGLSRIYLERHFLSDVIAGAIIGYFIADYIIKRYLK